MPDLASDNENHEAERFCPCGDDAFKELYATHFNALVGYLRGQFRSCTHHAEEIAQDAFEKIATMGSLGAIGNLKAYLWRAAHNIAISGIRSRRLSTKYRVETEQLFSAGEGYHLTPERVLETNQQAAIALAVLRRMPEQRRRAFVLTRLEGLSHAEASERMGVSRPAVSKHVAKATAELYAALHHENSHEKDDRHVRD